MKKTTTSNPLKFFNDAKAARNKSFSKSLPKAQDGFGVNDTMNDDMINKAGSTGGYKVPTPTWSAEESANISKAISGLTRPKDMLGANAERMMALQGEAAEGNLNYMNSIANKPNLKGLTQEELRARGIIKKTGGTHKMPNGKVMLNSAMKKKTSKKK